MRWVVVVILAASLPGGWHWWTRERAVGLPPGVVAPDAPVQVELAAPRTFTHRGYQFFARTHYDITARDSRGDLSTRPRRGARTGRSRRWLGSDVGHGVLDRIHFSQMGRFFYWDARDAGFPLPAQVLQSHAAQMHMVPGIDTLDVP